MNLKTYNSKTCKFEYFSFFVIYLNNYLYLYTYKERVQSSFDSLVNKVFVKISL